MLNEKKWFVLYFTSVLFNETKFIFVEKGLNCNKILLINFQLYNVYKLQIKILRQ
jgi:hypothetical protein